MNIPRGYKLVPVEITNEMLSALWSIMHSMGGPASQACYESMLAAAPAPPQPIYDEAKERELFEAYHRYNCGLEGRDIESEFHRDSDGEYIYCTAQDGWKYWSACAQYRAKAGEVGHE